MRELIKEDIIGPTLQKEYIAYLRRLDPDSTVQKKNHWASDGLSPCIRKLWLKFYGAELTNPDFNTAIMDLGNAIEDDVIENYKLEGKFVKEGRYIDLQDPRLNLRITGKIDVLIVQDGALMAVEIKSTKDFGEEYGYDNWKQYLPRSEHVAQLMAYLKQMNLPKGRVHYYNKNRSIEAWYDVTFSDEFYDEIVARFKKLEDALTGEEPAIEKGLTREAFPCQYYSKDKNKKEPAGQCGYFSHCYEQKPVTLQFKEIKW